MIYAFVDESGNLGKKGRFFVMAAIVFTTEKARNQVKRIVRKERQIISKENNTELIPEIKGKDLNFTQKQRIINKILSKDNVEFFYFIADKLNTRLLQQSISSNLVYNYFASLLIGKILTKHNQGINVIFDQRSTAVKSMNSLSDYLTINAYTKYDQWGKDIKVSQSDSRSVHNLQAADVISGAIYEAYTRGNQHFISLLKPKIISGEEFPSATFPNKLSDTSLT